MAAPSPTAAADFMAIAMARLLCNGERVFHGVASPLPMVAMLLAKRLHAPGLVYLNVAGSVDPHPPVLPRSTAAPELLAGATALMPLAELFDLSARGELDTAFLSGVQIDGEGRINMSVIGDFAQPKVRLPGGAGSALILPTARRTILWRSQHSPRTLVQRVDFVTAAGNVSHLVTPLALLRFHREHRHFALQQCAPGVSPAEVVAATGFALDLPATSDAPVPEFRATAAELTALAQVDPERVRDIEFH